MDEARAGGETASLLAEDPPVEPAAAPPPGEGDDPVEDRPPDGYQRL